MQKSMLNGVELTEREVAAISMAVALTGLNISSTADGQDLTDMVTDLVIQSLRKDDIVNELTHILELCPNGQEASRILKRDSEASE